MEILGPDFVSANGDMIYAGTACPGDGPIEGFTDWKNVPGGFPSIADPAVECTTPDVVREIYDEHWRYSRTDSYLHSASRNRPRCTPSRTTTR